MLYIQMIVSISPSPLKSKRFRVLFKYHDGKQKHFNFGLKDAFTYLDGADEKTRENYRKRHLASPNEGKLIRGLVPSPALFAYYLIWGDSRNIQTNIATLNRKWKN